MESLFLWKDALCVITDSGGLQEETTAIRKPCFTLRENTERPVTLKIGTNTLVKDKEKRLLPDMLIDITKDDVSKRKGAIPEKWDGKASFRIIEILRSKTEIG